MKRIREIAIWSAILVYLVVSMSFVKAKRKLVKCNNIIVTVTDTTKNFFVEKDDILTLIADKGIKLKGSAIDSINTAKLEDLIYRHPSIRSAEVYRLDNGDLAIEIEQRNPILRIINKNHESYYIDEEGCFMPLSQKYTAHVMVVNGYINEPFSPGREKIVLSGQEAKDTAGGNSYLKDLYKLGKYIFHDKFWHSQIEQIFVEQDKELDLIPRVGDQVILFGYPDNYEEKLAKLDALYRKGFNNLGWNFYKTINLKYNNQVVCTKK